MSREVEAMGLGGDSPSLSVRSTIKRPEANKLGPVVPSGQAYWPRFSRQLFDRTGPSPSSRDTLFPYLSFMSSEQLSLACRNLVNRRIIDYKSLGMMLGISPRLILQIARHPVRHYRRFEVPKRGGGSREISSPRVFLKVIQRFLLDYILFELPVSHSVFSFRKEVSILDNAKLHLNKNYVANLDIKYFVGSLKRGQIFRHLNANGFSKNSSALIGVLVTVNDTLPQGAPTSPLISNSILYEFDERMLRISRKFNLTYTRYADDISISGDSKHRILELSKLIENELKRDFDLNLNLKKYRLSSKNSRQSVTGLVVNEFGFPSRQYRRKIRSAFHNAHLSDDISQVDISKLEGYLSYLSRFIELRTSDHFERYRQIIADFRLKCE